MVKFALFDLDGTLTDPALGITNSIMYALGKMGREIPPREELYSFIGPPLVPTLQSYLNITENEAQNALMLYREYFADKGLFENRPYDGIAETLGKIKKSGVRLAVATSKPEEYAVKILETFALAEYFDAICGATMDEKRVKKADIIRYALDTLGALANDCIMIGDRHHDIDGAHENGMKSIGVLWGYGSREELEGAGADMIAESVGEICGIVEKLK